MVTMRRTKSEFRQYLHKIVINDFINELLFVSCVERFRTFGDPRKPSEERRVSTIETPIHPGLYLMVSDGPYNSLAGARDAFLLRSILLASHLTLNSLSEKEL
jgi:hypothetical protein